MFARELGSAVRRRANPDQPLVSCAAIPPPVLAFAIPAPKRSCWNQRIRSVHYSPLRKNPRWWRGPADLENEVCTRPGRSRAALGMGTDALPFNPLFRDQFDHSQFHHSVLRTRVVFQDQAAICLGGRLFVPSGSDSVCLGNRLVYLHHPEHSAVGAKGPTESGSHL
jgi:hypothetical protein